MRDENVECGANSRFLIPNSQFYMPGQLHARRQHPAHPLRHLFVGLAMRVVDRGDDQILQHPDVLFRETTSGSIVDRLHLLWRR